jgi:DNA-binding transcriptional LysR family regulator
MDRSTDTLDSGRLLAFAVVAREQGFSRAARALGKTQSAVSQAVMQLERELGQPLFARDGRVARLTAAGRALFEPASRILEDMARARAAVAALSGLASGRLVIGTSDTLAYYFLPPFLAAFRRRYPEIELRLDNRPTPATAEGVAERRVDLGVITLPLPPELRLSGRKAAERLQIERLAPARDVAICPPGHAFARRRRVGVAELARAPLLALDRTTASRALLEAAFAAAGVRPNVVMEMSSVEVLKRLVELGFGVSVVPELAVERETRSGCLVALRLAGMGPSRRIGLLLPRAGPLSSAALAFRKILSEHAPRPAHARRA